MSSRQLVPLAIGIAIGFAICHMYRARVGNG